MDRVFEKNLFSEVENFFSSKGLAISYEDIESKSVLVMEPDGENSFIDCSISTGEIENNITDVTILFSLATDLPAEISDKVDDLLVSLNKYLTVGSFGLIKENGYFYFTCSYLADTQAQTEQTMKVFLMTWQIAADTAVQGLQTVISVINGETDNSVVTSDDISIIQFD